MKRRPRSGRGDLCDAGPEPQLLQKLRLVNSQIDLLSWYRELSTLRCQAKREQPIGPGQGGVMAIRRGRARTENGATAAGAAATAAVADGADRQDDMIQLSCHTG